MYAIRSYYVKIGIIGAMEQEVAILREQLTECDVITSYSIHYTKLYEVLTVITLW